MFKSFSSALSFLTVLRIPFSRPMLRAEDLAASFASFPLVGGVLGLICFLLAAGCVSLVPGLLLSVLITGVMAILTRGLHLDGLADFVDGVGGGSSIERRLEIMKDSRTGAFGVCALVLALALKIAAIDALLAGGNLVPLLLAPVLSRFAMTLAAFRSPYARAEGGLGRSFVQHMQTSHLIAATIFTALICVTASPLYAIFYAVPVVCWTGAARYFSGKWLGGITGDVLGAVNETSEIIVLTIAACVLRS